ncbi:hypothetical protein [Nocardia sp. NPDC049149]|uniref:hypothetical protein n=1 Tax=Nocardia sp. NPDC049149 TaxID=3364315 RepID=UPI00372122E6
MAPNRPLTLEWQPGERQQWAEIPLGSEELWRIKAASFLGDLADPRMSHPLVSALAVAPDELALPHLRTFKPCRFSGDVATLRRLLGRFGVQALDFVFSAVQHNPLFLDILAPIDGTAVSVFWARWLNSGTRRTAKAIGWFDRHFDTAATDLIAVALSRSGKDRVPAERALRILAAAGQRGRIQAAAAAYHPAAPAAVDAILDVDPRLLLPGRIPQPRQWMDLDRLPKLRRHGSHDVWPITASVDFVSMLMMCRPGNYYAGVRDVIQVVDPLYLAGFGRGLLAQWGRAGYPAKDDWVLHVQGLLGDHETVNVLETRIQRWSHMADASCAAIATLRNGRLQAIANGYLLERP